MRWQHSLVPRGRLIVSGDEKGTGTPHRCLATHAQTSSDTSRYPSEAPRCLVGPSSTVAPLVVGPGATKYTAWAEAESCLPSLDLSYRSILLFWAVRRGITDLMVGSSSASVVVSVSHCEGGGCFLLALPLFLGVDGATTLPLLFLDLGGMIVRIKLKEKRCVSASPTFC